MEKYDTRSVLSLSCVGTFQASRLDEDERLPSRIDWFQMDRHGFSGYSPGNPLMTRTGLTSTVPMCAPGIR